MAATAVGVTVEYDDSQVTPGVNRTTNALGKIGDAGGKAGKKASDGQKQLTNSSKQAHDAVQLLSETLGIRMPRELQKVLAHSKMIGPALGAAFNVAVIAAAADVVVGFAEKLKDVADAAVGLTEKVKESAKEQIRMNEEVFTSFKTKSLGDVMVKSAVQLKGAADATKEFADVSRVEMAKSYVVSGQYGMALGELIAGTYAYEKATDQAVVAGDRQNKVLEHQTEVTEQQTEAQMQLRGEIELIGKRGYAKIAQEQTNAIEEVNYKFRNSIVERNQFTQMANSRAAAQRRDLLRSELDDTRKQRAEVVSIGLKGVATVLQKERDSYTELEILRSRSEISEKTYSDRRVLIHQRALAEIRELLKAMDEDTRKSIEATNAYGQEGLNRITVDTANKLADLQHQFNEVWSALPDTDPNKQRAAQDLAIQRYNIERQAAIDRDKYIRDEARETQQIETEAASSVLTGWQKTYFDISSSAEERVQKVRTDLSTGVIDEQTAARREAAIRRQENAQIAQEHQRMVEDLASQYESLFDDITSGNLGKRILKNMEHFFALILAQWTATTRGMGGAAGGVGMAGGGGMGGLASILFGGGMAGMGTAGGVGIGGGGGTPPFIPGSSFAGGPTGLMTGGGMAGGLGGPGGGINVGLAGVGGGMGPGGFGGGILGTILGGRGGTLAATPKQAALGLGLPAAVGAVGYKLGGIPGAVGAGVGALGIAAAMGNPAALSMITALGISPALAAGAAGAGVGFGIGMQHGKLAGSLSGIGAGAVTGFMVGGPIGAAIGAIAGLLGGLFGGWFGGSKRKKQAEKLSSDFVAQINQTVEQFKSYELDGAQAIGQVEAIKGAAWDNLSKLKGEGKSVYNHQILPAVTGAEAQINRLQTERDRRSGLLFGPAQFHTGGKVHGAIGSYRAGQDEVLAVLKRGEIIMNERASQKNEAKLNAMNAGAGGDGGGGGMTVVIKALDSSDVRGWMRNGGGRQLQQAFRSASAEGGF